MLALMRDAYAKSFDERADSSVPHLILRHGRSYEPAPLDESAHEFGRAKECFRNAALLAQENAELTYVEGYADCGSFPMHHAWCVDANGRVVDPTWREKGASPIAEWEYLGIPLTTEFVTATLLRKQTWGVLDGRWIQEHGLPEEAIA